MPKGVPNVLRKFTLECVECGIKFDSIRSTTKFCGDKCSHDAQYNANPEMAASRSLKYLYGITLEQKREMYAEQGGRCAACSDAVAFDKTKVDHNHETGQTRSLLCHRCNILVGFLENSLAVAGLQSYIDRWRNSNG